MEEDETVGATEQPLLDDRPRFDRGAAQRSAIDVTLGYQAVADVEIESAHHLLVVLRIAEGQIGGYGVRPVQKIAPGHPDAGEAAGELNRRQQSSAAGRANAREDQIALASFE